MISKRVFIFIFFSFRFFSWSKTHNDSTQFSCTGLACESNRKKKKAAYMKFEPCRMEIVWTLATVRLRLEMQLTVRSVNCSIWGTARLRRLPEEGYRDDIYERSTSTVYLACMSRRFISSTSIELCNRHRQSIRTRAGVGSGLSSDVDKSHEIEAIKTFIRLVWSNFQLLFTSRGLSTAAGVRGRVVWTRNRFMLFLSLFMV